MDYMRSVTYVAEDKDWLKKIGMGAVMTLLSVVLVGQWALTGWAMEAFRRVVRHSDEELPDWDDLGAYIGQGLKYFVVTLVWSLPMIVVAIALAGTMAAASNLESGEAAAIAGTLFFWLVAMLYSLAASFLSIGAFVILAQTDDLGQAINPVNAWHVVSRDLGKWVLSGLFILLVSMVFSAIGGVLCGVGVLVATPWISAAAGNLLGQTFAETASEL